MTGLNAALLMFAVGGALVAIAALLNKRELDRLEKLEIEEKAKGRP